MIFLPKSTSFFLYIANISLWGDIFKIGGEWSLKAVLFRLCLNIKLNKFNTGVC